MPIAVLSVGPMLSIAGSSVARQFDHLPQRLESVFIVRVSAALISLESLYPAWPRLVALRGGGRFNSDGDRLNRITRLCRRGSISAKHARQRDLPGLIASIIDGKNSGQNGIFTVSCSRYVISDDRPQGVDLLVW